MEEKVTGFKTIITDEIVVSSKDAPDDQKLWKINTGNSDIKLRLLNDANDVSSEEIVIERTGTEWSRVIINGKEVWSKG